MLKYELQKLFSRKLIMLMIGLCLLNILQLYYLEKKSSSYAANGAYKMLWEHITATAKENGNEVVYEQYRKEAEEKDLFLQFYMTYIYGGFTESMYSEEFLEKAFKRLKEEQLDYEVLNQENHLYALISAELGSITGFDAYLTSIDDNAAKLSTISIFRSKNSFANRNIRKTPKAYAKMKGVKLDAAPSKGVEMFSTSIITDMIAVFLILYCAVIIWTKEKNDGMKALLFSCYRGRRKLAAVKVMTLLIVCLLIEALLYGGNFLSAARLYGIGNLSRYLSSVYAFSQTTWKVSVLEYLMIFVAAKYAAYIFVSFLISMISELCNSMIFTFGCIIATGTISVLTYSGISSSSAFSIFKYLLPYGLLRTENLYMTYLNLNLFGHPVELTICTYLLFMIGTVIGPIVLLQLYVRRQREVKLQLSILSLRLRNLFTMKLGERTNLWYHELYKVLITQKVLYFLLIFCSIQFIIYQPKEISVVTPNEYYYKQYMLKLSGPVTEEKLQFLSEEREKFKLLNAEYIEQLSQGRSSYTMEQELQHYQAFQWVLERLDYLKMQEGSYFVYDIPYKELTAGYQNKNDTKLALEYILLLIICTAGIFGMDYQLKAEKLCLITYKGRYREVLMKFMIGILISLFLLISVYLPFIHQIWLGYGMDVQTLGYPVNSLPNLYKMGAGLTIGGYLSLIFLSRYLYSVVICFTVFLIAYKVRSIIGTNLAAMLIFALPTGFLLISEKFISAYYIFSPILGNLPWTYSQTKLIILVAIMFIMIAMSLIRVLFAHRIRE